ncbi:MAG: AAA family ATPase, partial [candidate division NC10 bacterium]|nr:AAA family ATPase [candidate division NC10 bacterium]
MAVLAIELTFPPATELEAPRYEPWTMAARWEETLVEKVQGFGGILLQRSPSLLAIIFGIPRTLEQLPQRAVQAALVIRHLITEARRSEEGQPCPEVRLAAHVGALLVESQAGAPTEHVLAVGDTLALPVRLLGQAAPGEIVVSPDVGRLVEGWFELEAREVPLGGETPGRIIAYTVTGLGPRRFPLARLERWVQSRFVGRERELAALEDLRAQAEGGRGQVVGIVGEPGVGKSRLGYEFTRSPRSHGWLVLESTAVSYGKTTAYLPVIDLLKAYFQIEDHDEPRKMHEKVTGKLLTLDEALRPTLPALLALLEVPVEDPEWQALDPLQRRQRTLDAVKRLLLRESQVQPVLLVFEDLHWSDTETQVFLDSLIESLPTHRILLLVSFRPEYQHGWGNKTYATQLRLDPLPPERAEELLEALLGGKGGAQHAAPLQALKQLLIEQTEGNPFFLEESVWTLVEQGVLVRDPNGGAGLRPAPTMNLSEIRMPATVQAVLAARIGRLPP